MRTVTRVTVTYEDGTTETWTGRGTSDVTRTGVTRSNKLEDNNLRYVTVTLKLPDQEAPHEG